MHVRNCLGSKLPVEPFTIYYPSYVELTILPEDDSWDAISAVCTSLIISALLSTSRSFRKVIGDART
jgi:hypothetical protein